ncbi:MAG TPA: hypothetical protein PLT25_05830 [Acidocella sp.]|nr:hypothetical protein [Acidocella sp.]
MASIRERILEKMVTVLNAGAIGAPVYRSRTDPVSRAQSPAVLIQPVSDTAKQVSVPYLDWELLTHVAVYVRGNAPDTLADPILTALNSALLADMSLGGLAMQIMPVSVHFEFSDSDTQLCVATCEYKIDYRTNQQDLTQ